MRAAQCTGYGGPEVVEVAEVTAPAAQGDQLLIRVTSSTVNRTCAAIRSATPPLAIRLAYGLRRPRRPVLGTDFAGVVEQIGPRVYGFEVGDRVFGFDDRRMGAHGEVMVLPVSAAVASIPGGVSDDDAAASVEGAHYALSAIDRAGLEPGQRALVYGGGGAIGSTAVQLLAARGVDVVAAVEAHQLTLMVELGAGNVVDVHRGGMDELASRGERFQWVFDAVGKIRYAACRDLLAPSGRFTSSELGPRMENLRLDLRTRFGGEHRVVFPWPDRARQHVKAVRAELEAGTLRPVIDQRFELDDIVEAYRYVDTGTKTGNVVLQVAPPVV